jgi:porin
LIPPEPALQTVDHSWAFFAGAWQYLYTPDSPPDEIDAGDDRADLRGVGLFARLGFADPDANPVDWSASVGIGGRGLIPGREGDSFGAAYYHTRTQAPRGFALLGLNDTGQGLEAYYNIAVTPAVGLTLDVQWIDEGLESNNPATVIGARLHVDF